MTQLNKTDLSESIDSFDFGSYSGALICKIDINGLVISIILMVCILVKFLVISVVLFSKSDDFRFADFNDSSKLSNTGQGRIQDFYNGVSISKKLQEYIGISSDQLLTI